MIKTIIMMIWRVLPSWSLMKMPDVSRQEEHLMHEGDRMATVMGFLSEVSEICRLIFIQIYFVVTSAYHILLNYHIYIIQVELGGLTSFPYVGTYLKPEKVISKIQSIFELELKLEFK